LSSKRGMAPIDVCKLTRELIDIPSVTGDEAEVGQFIARLLGQLGYDVELQEVMPGRVNVIATKGAPPHVVLSTHMDTVPPHIAAREDEEFIHGRGACDAKGIIAAQISAAEKLRAAGCNEVGLLFTVDEEAASAGARAANAHRHASSCRYLINGEPTDNHLAIGSKGSLQVIIKCSGRAAHSAYPEQGESAIEKLLDVLADVRKLSWHSNEVFGATTCNFGVIAGGTRPNVVPAEAQAALQIRLATSAESVQHLLEDAVAGRASLKYAAAHDPQRMLAVEGFEQTIVRFTTDIPYLSNWGAPLLIGPGSILNAHSAHERVAKKDLLRAVKVYTDLARLLLSREEGQGEKCGTLEATKGATE